MCLLKIKLILFDQKEAFYIISTEPLQGCAGRRNPSATISKADTILSPPVNGQIGLCGLFLRANRGTRHF